MKAENAALKAANVALEAQVAFLSTPSSSGGPHQSRMRNDSTITQQVQAVTSHAAEYVQRWWSGAAPVAPSMVQMYGQLLLAGGRGPARIPTCCHTLRHVPTRVETQLTDEDDWDGHPIFEEYPKFRDGVVVDYGPTSLEFRESGRYAIRVDFFYPIIVRALWLFDAGELRALRVRDPNVFRIIASMLPPFEDGEGGASGKNRISQALDSLCAIEKTISSSHWKLQSDAAAALIERCAGTLTEVRGQMLREEHQPALARCKRLESLSVMYVDDSSIWLGLSQLHTLCDVDLAQVSFAAIAAALPQLHTLKAVGYRDDPVEAAAFFADLLPRLRVFTAAASGPGVERGWSSTP
jgi:hypothetical protein